MGQYYRLHYDSSLNSSRTDEDAKKAYDLAKNKFAPLYFIRSYPDDKKKVEMSFELTNYQPQVSSRPRCITLPTHSFKSQSSSKMKTLTAPRLLRAQHPFLVQPHRSHPMSSKPFSSTATGVAINGAKTTSTLSTSSTKSGGNNRAIGGSTTRGRYPG